MEITDVKVIPVEDEKLKAFVSIVFDQCFVVTDIKVIHGPKGLFVSMPSKKRKDGTFKDIAHPLNNQMRQYLEEKVLSVYKQQVAGQPSSHGAPTGGSAPGGSAPGGSAPGGSTPGGSAPGNSTPGSSTPGGSTPQDAGGGAGSSSGPEQASSS